MPTLLAGRELDVLIAEKVMGYERCHHVSTRPLQPDEWWADRDGMHEERSYGPPSFSTDIAAAWQVVERLRSDDHGWHFWLPNSGGFYEEAIVYNGRDTWTGQGLTVPEAICRAALAAVEARP